MNKKKIKDLIKSREKLSVNVLVEILKKLSDSYYNTGKPIVSDAIYDELIDLLKKKDSNNEYLSKIGFPIKGTKEKIKLPFPMGSLDKIKPQYGNLGEWINEYGGNYIISDKLDGASVQFYKNESGEIKLFSRGDGLIGQDITHLLKFITFGDIPNGVSIRGEFIINKKNFKKIQSFMKNARNAVSGLINSKHVDVKVAKIVDFVTYSILSPRYKQLKQMQLLNKWGFKVVNYKIISKIDENTLKKYLIERKKNSEYEIDGIVCIDNSKIYEHKEGNPEYGFAFKMDVNEDTVNVLVKRVIWEPSIDGYLKPRIEIEPIELSGVTITFVTGYNAKFIIDNKIGVGSIIKIIRSGEVIPKVLEIVKSTKAEYPNYKYKWNNTKVDLVIGEDNDANKIVIIKNIINFFNRIGVKYMSKGIITKLYDNGYTSIFSILKADNNKLMKIKGLGEKSVDKITKEINNSFNNMDLATFMNASHKFGRGFGEKKIKEILNIYPKILHEKLTKDKLKHVKGIDDKLANLFISNFDKFKIFYEKINKIKDISKIDKPYKKVITGKLFKNEVIVMTGFRDEKIKQFIINNGGIVNDSVSKKTTLLIQDDDEEKSAKIDKAKKLGIKIIKRSNFENKNKRILNK